MIKKVKKLVPELRFPEFHEDWQTDRIDRFLVRYVNPVDVQLETNYKQIGIKSHGKGIFHKDPVTGEELGNKRVYWVHPEAFTVNIVFAWEQAVALTSSAEQGFIASHRFLMFLPKENRADLKFVLLFFLRKRGKYLLELASPGGAGRNKTLGQDSFAELKITLPKKEEQEKIVGFLEAINTRLTKLRRKHELLQAYKRGVMRKIFSRKIRFKHDDGKSFSDWEKKKLGELGEVIAGLTYSPSDIRNEGLLVLRSSNIQNRRLTFDDCVFVNTVVNSESLSREGDILICVRNGSTNLIGKNALIPKDIPLSTHGAFMVVFRGNRNNFIFQLFQTNAYSKQVYQDLGARINSINSNRLRKYQFSIPCIEEQDKIADFLMSIDKKIEAVTRQIDLTEKFRKGLLQKMFV